MYFSRSGWKNSWFRAVAFCSVVSVPAAIAHVPHDLVHDVAISPAFAIDQTVYTTVRGSLFRSGTGGYEWQRLTRGINCAEDLTALSVSPDLHRDDTLFVACSSGGLYRSLDRGDHWQQLATGGATVIFRQIALSPRFAEDSTALLLDTEGGLWRSEDRGDSWQQLPIDSELTTLGWNEQALGAASKEGLILVSSDTGHSWQEFVRLPVADHVTAILPPQSAHKNALWLIATASEGVLRFNPEGAALADNNFAGEHVTALATDPGKADQLYLTTWNRAVFRSTNGGDTWDKYGDNLHRSSQADHYDQAHFTDIDVAADGTVIGGGFCGLFSSRDQGLTWDPLAVSLHHITGIDTSPGVDGTYAVALATYGGGSILSLDAGQNGHSHNLSLKNSRLGPMLFLPDYADSGAMLSGSYNYSNKSTGSGEPWQVLKLPPRYTFDWFQVRAVRLSRESAVLKKILDLLNPGIKNGFVFPVSFHPSPNYTRDRVIYAVTYPGGLMRSNDAAETFEILQGIKDIKIESFIVMLNKAGNPMMLASTPAGLFKSTDSGSNWEALSEAEHIGPAQLALAATAEGEHTVFAGNRQGIFETRNQGKTWEQRYLASASAGPVRTLAVSPDFQHDNMLFLQHAGGPLNRCHQDESGYIDCSPVSSTRDFSHMVSRDLSPILAFSPYYKQDGTVFAASMGHLMRSDDRGINWQRVPITRRFEPEGVLQSWMFLPMELTGHWSLEQGQRFSSSHSVRSDKAGSELSFKFYGSGIRWLVSHNARGGRAQVYLDGQLVSEVDQFAEQEIPASVSFEHTFPSRGIHSIDIRVLPAESGVMADTIDIDALDVIP